MIIQSILLYCLPLSYFDGLWYIISKLLAEKGDRTTNQTECGLYNSNHTMAAGAVWQ